MKKAEPQERDGFEPELELEADARPAVRTPGYAQTPLDPRKKHSGKDKRKKHGDAR